MNYLVWFGREKQKKQNRKHKDQLNHSDICKRKQDL